MPGSPLAGIALVIAAVACFAALDTTTKLAGASASIVMVLWFRYLFQMTATIVVFYPTEGVRLLRTRRPLLQLIRGVLLLLCSVLAFLSLRYMPVGEFTAIVLLTPLLITVIAVTSLGQKVSALRWLFLIAGFAGALVVVRPGGQGFGWAALLPLALVAVNAGYQLLTSELARTDGAASMQFYAGCIGTVAMSCALPFFWQELGLNLWLIFIIMGFFGTLGHLLLIHGYKKAPVSTLTPFLYLQIGFAMLYGWLVFDHVPDSWSLIGVAVIGFAGAAGTYVAAREARRAA